jgi:hypothetical protein
MSQPPILPFKPRRKQGHTWLPVVRGDATKDRLEEGMDRPLSTPHYIPYTRRCQSPLLPKDDQYPQRTPYTKDRMTIHPHHEPHS